MSRKLKRRLNARRALRIESLESRRMMHSQSLSLFAPSSDSPEPVVAAQVSGGQSLALDANGDGRVGLDELQSWLSRWRGMRDTATVTPPATSDDSAAPNLSSDPVVAAPVLPDVLPAAPDFGGRYDWHLNAINAPEAWAAGHTGDGVTVAVIDTGVDFRHSELRGKLWTNPGEIAGNGRDDDGNGFVDDVHGWDFVNQDAVPQDRNGHGTHVSSLIVAARNGAGATGVAYDSQLMVLQGLGADGVGDTRDIAAAVRYAVDEGADIINVSLSGGRSSSLDSAILYANSRGVLVVAAAGNQGLSQPNAPASLSKSLGNVLSVGAYDQAGRLASFSNLAGTAVQVVAPGVRLRGAVPGGQALYSGTSMAAPLVTGVAALALSASPNLTGQQLRDLLVEGAAKSIVGDNSFGAINAAITVASAQKLTPPQSVTLATPTLTSSTHGRQVRLASVDDDSASQRNPFTPIATHRASLTRSSSLPTNVHASLADLPMTRSAQGQSSTPRLRVWAREDDVESTETLELLPPAVDAALRAWAA